MNNLAISIFELEHPKEEVSTTAQLSLEETRLLSGLETLLVQTSENLAKWLDEGPYPTDWAVLPVIGVAN